MVINRYSPPAPALVVLFVLGTGSAMLPASGMPDPIIELSPFIVEERPDDTVSGSEINAFLSAEDPRLPLERLADLPGFSFSSRGTGSGEPMLRGLGYDRVVTTLNGLPLPNGSPTRTHAPINQFGNVWMGSMQISRMLPSLTLGPPASGGRIDLSGLTPDPEPGEPAVPEHTASLHWFPDRSGVSGIITTNRITGGKGLAASLYANQLGNYKSGNGRTVPSHHRDIGGALSVIHSSRDAWQHSLDGAIRKQRFTENISLPLDVTEGEFFVLSAAHERRFGDINQPGVRLRYGISDLDTFLSNHLRPGAPIDVRTRAEARSLHADLSGTIPLLFPGILQLGIDANSQQRKAVRFRGESARDHIWPDIHYEQLGAYAEARIELLEHFSLRAGIRGDAYDTKAKATRESAFGRTIASWYDEYNEKTGQPAHRRDTGISGNVILSITPSASSELYLGMASTIQTPPPTERYRALLNALGGGFEIGNPYLQKERKNEIVAGFSHRSAVLSVGIDLYHFRLDDFIWRQLVGTADFVNLPASEARVFGYRNVAASFSGAELSASYRPLENLVLSLSMEWIEAELEEAGPGYAKGDNLPEIPPVEIRARVVYKTRLVSLPARIEWNSVYAHSRENDLPGLNPLYADTGSYWLHGIALQLSIDENWSFSLRGQNLFGKEYAPYLMPPVSSPPPDGDLQPGDRVPGPGRELVFSLQCTY